MKSGFLAVVYSFYNEFLWGDVFEVKDLSIISSWTTAKTQVEL